MGSRSLLFLWTVFSSFPLKNYDNDLQIVTLVFPAYYKMPVLHEEQELLPNVKEVSITQGAVDELELLEKQSKTNESVTSACIEMERLGLAEKLPESQEEMKSLTDERDNLKMIEEAVQAGRDQLKEDIKEILAKVSFILSFYLPSVL